MRLHTAGEYGSTVLAMQPGLFAGARQTAQLESTRQAGFWSDPSNNWTSLATGFARVTALSQSQQGGEHNGRAAIWSGTPGSIVYLQELTSPYSATSVVGMADGQQVGNGRFQSSTNQHALLWHGTAASLVDLGPVGSTYADVRATDGVRQVGTVALSGGIGHAGYWSGSAETWVDLNPPNAIGSSLNAMSGHQLVGGVDWGGPQLGGAAMWPDLTPNVIDLRPYPNYGSSQLLGTIGTAQVGWSHVPGYSLPHAGIWFGSAQSFLDLHAFLPAGFSSSVANCITEENGTITVGGAADGQAFIWVGVPAPSSAGLLIAAGLLSHRRRRAR